MQPAGAKENIPQQGTKSGTTGEWTFFPPYIFFLCQKIKREDYPPA
jgi:hypothetical protein